MKRSAKIVKYYSTVGVLVLIGCAEPDDLGSSQNEAAEEIQLAEQNGSPLGQSVPAPPGVKIKSVRATGTGCPGPTSYDPPYINPEGTAFSVVLKQFNVQVSPLDLVPERTMNCTFRIVLDIPPGFTYAVTDLKYFGYASLEPGQTADLKVGYGFTGSTFLDSSRVAEPIRPVSSGGLNSEWNSMHRLEASETGFLPCGDSSERELLSSATITVHNVVPRKSGYVSLSQASGETGAAVDPVAKPNLVIGLKWQKCPVGLVGR